MTLHQSVFESVCRQAREAALLTSIADTLEWDERTGMPLAAGEYRAEQVSMMRASAHRLRTSGQYGEQLQQLSDTASDESVHSDTVATVRELHRDWQRDCKLPTELVEQISQATVRGQQSWDAARKANDFAAFAPALSKIIDLKREAGQRMAEGTGRSAYEALMDEYEPDARVESLTQTFDDLRTSLTKLIHSIRNAPRQPNVDILKRDFCVDAQRQFSRRVAAAVGFDFARGRLDETSHPFCTTLGPNDCRILTRYQRNWLPAGLFGTLHEAGHGMYEQGLRTEWFGLPPGRYVSLGIHESQSRLWENQVGRSLPFWRWLYAETQSTFSPQLDDIELDTFHFAINQVQPSLIRVEADEATYNLHILIRFELERRLIEGTLSVNELPDEWNSQYQSCLGIHSETDADGVLQDVHWSAGLFGYFPTYTLGNLAAAQLFDAAKKQLGDVDGLFQRGEFQPLLEWLRQNVHRHGACYTGEQLVQNATGEPLSADHLIRDLTDKLQPLYGF
ncbi:carboxypeptidase M32 [Stieleria varia]|uniref:Metal-dependent carboxypeptidase n=1 Tax=Stieleria varia TaxID=2528005 RepID=A0A5C6A222_9BACT|nr:carboxypeptidase M32 [Stieleria varia]TWT93902.1 Thermostable carboxypeptidase 1 [Stieleria varia]